MSGKYARKAHRHNAVLSAWALFVAAVVIAVATTVWVWPDIVPTLLSETFWQSKTVIASAMAVCVVILAALLLVGRTPRRKRVKDSQYREHRIEYGSRMV